MRNLLVLLVGVFLCACSGPAVAVEATFDVTGRGIVTFTSYEDEHISEACTHVTFTCPGNERYVDGPYCVRDLDHSESKRAYVTSRVYADIVRRQIRRSGTYYDAAGRCRIGFTDYEVQF